MSSTLPRKTLLSSLPGAQARRHRQELDAAYARVMDSEWFILGSEVKNFEAEYAEFCEVPYAVGVANGTEAIQLALLASGAAPGGEVITVSHTAVATVAAITLAGFRPVLVDIDPTSYCMAPDALRAAITNQTVAVIAVHLYGHPCDIEEIEALCHEHNLKLIEDCAQAHGARWDGRRVGTFGVAAATSFYPTKNLGAIGDGGAVTTQDPHIAQRVKELREYGWRDRYVSATPGMNSRLDELQAAFLRAKLPHLDMDNARRQEIASMYTHALGDLPLVLPTVDRRCESVFHLYVVQTQDRDALQAFLRERSIHCGVHYPVPIHKQEAYRHLDRTEIPLPHTEAAAKRVLSLPMYPELEPDDIDWVIRSIRSFYTG